MTLRKNIRCLICGHVHTLRIAIGYSKEQRHTVLCVECGEEMKISLSLESPQTSKISYLENIEECEEEGTIINLHPEFLVPEKFRHQDIISMNILAMQQEMDKIKEASKHPPLTRQEKLLAEKEARGILVLDDEWKDLKKSWSQLSRGNTKLADKLALESKAKYCDIDDTSKSWIFTFSLRVLAPKKEYLFHDAIDLIQTIEKKNPENFYDFLTHHVNQERIHLKKYFNVFDDFFKSYGDFSQHFLAQKKGHEREDVVVSSCNFRDTMYYYGNAFERLGANISTLACLSNLNKGRKHNEFASANFTLDKYLLTDKALRTDCFSDINEFSSIVSCYNSAIRNGSHHATFELDSKTMTVNYRPKKKPDILSMKYADYIDNCVSIFISCATMVAIDLLLGLRYNILTAEKDKK